MWTHETIQPYEPGDEPIECEKLSAGGWIDLEIIHESDGRFYIQALRSCDAETDIGDTDTLDSAKQLAEKWALDQIGEMLRGLLNYPHSRDLVVKFPAVEGVEEL